MHCEYGAALACSSFLCAMTSSTLFFFLPVTGPLLGYPEMDLSRLVPAKVYFSTPADYLGIFTTTPMDSGVIMCIERIDS